MPRSVRDGKLVTGPFYYSGQLWNAYARGGAYFAQYDDDSGDLTLYEGANAIGYTSTDYQPESSGFGISCVGSSIKVYIGSSEYISTTNTASNAYGDWWCDPPEASFVSYDSTVTTYPPLHLLRSNVIPSLGGFNG